MKAIITMKMKNSNPNAPKPDIPDEENKNVTSRQISPDRIRSRSNSSNWPISFRKSCKTKTKAWNSA